MTNIKKKTRTVRTLEQKLECLKKVIQNSKEHIKCNDPKRIYSQYIRYAMDEFVNENLYVSEKAKGLTRKDVIREHVIPHFIIMEKLLELDPLTIDGIKLIIEKYYFICSITKDEDKKLNEANLRKDMPENWDESKDSVFARYEKVGISIYKDDK